ncbi:MAG: hypothetical protein QG608_2895 [Actinomycetota bacterium]|nr:hypothetical protein [Actinomycetota bacterium]
MTVLDELIVAMGKARDDVESLESSAGTVLEMLGDRADLAAQIGAESMAVRLRNGQEAAERTYLALTQTGDVTDEMLSAVQDVSLRTLSTEVLDALKRAGGLLDRMETDIGTVTQCVQEAHEAVEQVNLEEPLALVQDLSAAVGSASEGIEEVRKHYEATLHAVEDLCRKAATEGQSAGGAAPGAGDSLGGPTGDTAA